MAKFQPAPDGSHSDYVVPESLDPEIDKKFTEALGVFHSEADALHKSIANMANKTQALLSGITILEKSFALVEGIVRMIQLRQAQDTNSQTTQSNESRRTILANSLLRLTTATTPDARLGVINDTIGRLLS